MIKINNVSKRYDNLIIFENFNLTVNEGKINCFLGASGIGKTTLLNMITGLEKCDSGTIEGLSNNSFSYIFQETRLLPWSTLKENINFVLKSIYDKSKCEELISNYLKLVDLSKYENYYPKELSGGMKQRASIARAFAYPSEILVMDEPFKGLDYELKNNLIKTFISIWNKDKRTVFLVTHDYEEALLLSDEIFILYDRPVKIKTKIKINIDKRLRKLDSKEMINLKKTILNEISSIK